MKKICVPKDLIAQSHLDFDRAETSELLETQLSDNVFKRLSDLGIFTAINQMGDSNIDAFEDEIIINPIHLQKVINSEIFDIEEGDLREIIIQIKILFEEALARKTGVFFFF